MSEASHDRSNTYPNTFVLERNAYLTLTTEAFTGKPHARSTPEFSFPEMFLPHEDDSLLTKVVMYLTTVVG